MLKWSWLSLVLIALDQITKQWASSTLNYAEPVAVMPFFNLTLLHNTGAAFSFLSDAGGWQRWFFTGVAVVVSAVILFWLKHLSLHKRWEAIGLALVLAGAVGNLLDRVYSGYVIDFLDFYYGAWHWPAFNVADISIFLGAAVLIIDSFRSRDISD